MWESKDGYTASFSRIMFVSLIDDVLCEDDILIIVMPVYYLKLLNKFVNAHASNNIPHNYK